MSNVQGNQNMVQRCIRIPIRISYPDKTLCMVLFEFLKQVLEEGRLLACECILQDIAFLRNGTTGIANKNGKDMSKSGALYRMCVESSMHKHFPTNSLATLINAHVLPLVSRYYKLVKKGKANIPTYRKSIMPVHANVTRITASGNQFQISSNVFNFSVLHFMDSDIVSITDKIIKKKKFCVKRMKSECKDINIISSKEKEIEEFKRIDKLLSIGGVAGMGKGIIFETGISKKDTGMKNILNNVINGTYQLSDSLFQIDGKDIYFLLSYKMPVAQSQSVVDSSRVLGIDVGCDCIIACAANEGHVGRRYFGYGEELNAQKAKFRAKNNRLQKIKGFHSKSVQWDLSDEEKHWVKTYCHTLVARLFDITVIPGGFGVIYAEDLSSLLAKQEPYKKVIWVPGMLLNIIEQKCNELGIKFAKGNPRNSSVRCHKCGYTSKFNRSVVNVKDFRCQKCGYTCHADYNAAKNIAMWDEVEMEYGYESDDAVESEPVDMVDEEQSKQDAESVILKAG
jgi:transposase